MPVPGDEPQSDENLSSAVERHLVRYFSGFEDGLPPPGVDYCVLQFPASMSVLRGASAARI